MANLVDMIKIAQADGMQTIPMDAAALMLLDPMETPIYNIITAGGKKSIVDHVKFEWPEGEHTAIQTDAAAQYLVGATLIVVDDASIFKAKQLITNINQGDAMLIESINYGTNTLTVTRGIGSAAAAQGEIDDVMLLIGSAEESGGSLGSSIVTPPVEKFNYVQILSEPVKISDLRKRSDVNMGPGMTENDLIMKAMKKHYREFELIFINGVRDYTVDANGDHYTTGGFFENVTVNVDDNGGTPTTISKADFDAWVKTLFDYGSTTKWLFAGSGVINAVSKYGEAIVQNKNAKLMELGLVVNTYITAFGELNIVHHKMLNAMGMSDRGLCIDLEQVWARYMTPTKTAQQDRITDITELRLEIQNSEKRSSFHEFLTYLGYQIMNDKAHGYIYNVTGGS